MSDSTAILETLARLEADVSAIKKTLARDASPWIRGDQAAARYAGYKSREAFRKWAAEHGVSPKIDGQINFWDRAAIARVRGRQIS